MDSVVGTPLTKANPAMATTGRPVGQPQRPTLIPDSEPFTGVINPLHGGKMMTLDHFHHGKSRILLLLE